MQTKPPALTFEVDAICASKTERLSISVSAPYVSEKGDWACLFELRGIKKEEEKHEYYGVDGLQALVLNLFYFRSAFSRLRKSGYVFCEIGSGEEIYPEEYFDVFIKPA